MTLSVISLLLNLLIAGLLIATISYCWLLNKRIKILQDSKSELANLLKHFDESTTRASESIIALQTASRKIGENIQTRIDKVNYLIDDLAFMIDKGNRLADQLDANFAVNRARSMANTVAPANIASEAGSGESEINDISMAKSAIKPVPVLERAERKEVDRSAHSGENIQKKANVSIESVLERVIGRVKPSQQQVKPAAPSRSRAEQELLDMIRTGIRG